MQTAMLSSRSNLAVRPRQARNSAFRQARTQRLNISAATLWSVQHKGKEYDLTDAVGKHKICTIKGKEANDCQKALQEVEGVDIVFEASGESDPVDSPSDLSLKNSDSSVEIKVDGKTLDKGSSVKLKIGSKIDVGGQATYQVLRNVRTHA
eukprot:jgi/Astpho2/8695/Aster-05264